MPSRNAQSQTLSLIPQNIDAPVPRPKLTLGHIIFLQEVAPDIRALLLVMDAEDQTSFKGVLCDHGVVVQRALCLRPGFAERSRGSICSCTSQEGCALYGFIRPTAQGTIFRLINVHLDSLGDMLRHRAQQMEILANVLCEPGCSGGVITGDFDGIGAEEDELVDKNELVGAWVALHGRANPDEAKWDIGMERRDGLEPDKVAMTGLMAKEMEILRPGYVEVPKSGEEPVEIPWSDYLRAETCLYYLDAAKQSIQTVTRFSMNRFPNRLR